MRETARAIERILAWAAHDARCQTATVDLPIIVVGAGGHAKVLVDALQRGARRVVGIADQNPALHGKCVLGIEVMGGDEFVRRHAPGSVLLANGIGSVASMQVRAAVYQRFKEEGYDFTTIIHPSAVIGSEVGLGEGVQVLAGAVVGPGVVIGDNSIVNTCASVDHDCHLGRHVHLAPGVVLSGGVTIGAGTHVGTGAVIIQEVTIGAGCLIAAGAVVIADLPPNSRVAGVPARQLKI